MTQIIFSFIKSISNINRAWYDSHNFILTTQLLMHNINNTNNAQFDDKNPSASPKVFTFGFFAENRYICTVMQGDMATAQAKRAGKRKTVQNNGRRCGNRNRKSVANRWYTLGLQMCRSTFIRTKEPFSEAPFLLPVRRKKRKTDCISSFCKNFDRLPEPKTKRPHENTGAARIIRTAPLFIHKLRHFIPTDDLSSR